MQSISTKTGDSGTSGLANGTRKPKTHQVFAVLGTADELNAHLGKSLVQLKQLKDCAEYCQTVQWLQEQLFYFGAEIAQSPTTKISDDAIETIEKKATKLQSKLQERWMKKFLLPGGSMQAADIDIARAVARRLELETWRLKDSDVKVRSEVYVFLNRLSDYLYLLRCAVNDTLAVTDIPFIK